MTPSPCKVGNALAVLLALPAPAMAALTERLIDRLDALDANPDLEPDDDGELTPDDEGDLDGPPVAGVATAPDRRPGRRGSFPASSDTGG